MTFIITPTTLLIWLIKQDSDFLAKLAIRFSAEWYSSYRIAMRAMETVYVRGFDELLLRIYRKRYSKRRSKRN